jgi:SAM-dependent methyltransferase
VAAIIDTIRGALRRERPVAEAGPERYDSWLEQLHGDVLGEIDRRCAGAGPEAFALFRRLDDDLWALLLTREYELYPNIRALLPELPDPALQVRWNGASGLALATQGKAFYARAKRLCDVHMDTPLAEAAILDYGCGWGRLTRFFARDVAPGTLHGCDPSEAILDVCRETRVPAVLARSEFLPERLPFDRGFDLVFAFSVFTHLSEEAHERSLAAIHGSLNPGGLLVLTIRPPAYLGRSEWLAPLLRSLGPDPAAALRQPRYLFAPHPADPGHPQFREAGMSYGETVITPAYVHERWTDRFEPLETGIMTEDPYQVVVALRRRD